MTLDHETMLEHAVLGSFLVEAGVSNNADFILEELSEEDFSRTSSRRMFCLFKEMRANDEAIDLVTVCARLKAKGELDSLGGEVFVSGLMDSVSTSTHIAHYAKEVKRNAVMRKIKREIILLNPAVEPDAIERIMGLIEQRDSGDSLAVVTPKEFMDGYLEDCYKSRLPGIKTGYPTLDNGLCPQAGDLVVVAARTNVGKTAYLTNVLVNMLDDKTTCLYCPTEMRPQQFMSRLLPLKTGISASKFRAKQFNAEDLAELESAVEDAKAYPLYLLDIAGPSIYEIKRAVKFSKCKTLFVDYLGRCAMTRESTRTREIEKFVVELKNECVKSGVLCFLAVQLSRRTDFDKAAPKLADLSDSSAVEKEADAVIFLWRNPDKKAEGNNPIIEAFLGKNRFGHMHKWLLDFDRHSLRMTETEE
ncbi:MAG: DnaB-like helicase C-terminal domain-containing protein [Elusimicrobiaceae bacterium]